jgi:acetyl esterase/lipase
MFGIGTQELLLFGVIAVIVFSRGRQPFNWSSARLFVAAWFFLVPYGALHCPLAKADPAVEVLRDRVYIERASGPLALDLYVPEGAGPFPGMLVVHGGAWHMGTRTQFAMTAMELARHGYAAAAISYRLAPQHKFPAQIHDCQAAVRWLRQHAGEFRIDPARIGGYGYSAGGQLVALLGALGDDELREVGVPADAPSARLQTVLAGAAPCDFRVLVPESRRLAYWLGGTPASHPESYRNASPAYFVTADDPPMFFFHGGQDELVPIDSPQQMVARLVAAGVPAELVTLPSAGHISPVFHPATLAEAIAFADRHLKHVELSRAAPNADSASTSATASKGGASHGQ